jgi:hypothetical protein
MALRRVCRVLARMCKAVVVSRTAIRIASEGRTVPGAGLRGPRSLRSPHPHLPVRRGVPPDTLRKVSSICSLQHSTLHSLQCTLSKHARDADTRRPVTVTAHDWTRTGSGTRSRLSVPHRPDSDTRPHDMPHDRGLDRCVQRCRSRSQNGERRTFNAQSTDMDTPDAPPVDSRDFPFGSSRPFPRRFFCQTHSSHNSH